MLEFKTELGRRERYVFALLMPPFVALVGYALERRTATPNLGLIVSLIGAAISVVGIAWPPLLRAVFLVWMALVYPIGWLVSQLLLVMLYYAVITPAALIMKLRRFDPMQRRFDRSAASYWQPRSSDSDARRYFRQF
ncbi:MAG: hypothetical protein FJ295_19255 [Planctomycetes bacterium]|nr:hypothetical protein [Planctomycetota bacterium]